MQEDKNLEIISGLRKKPQTSYTITIPLTSNKNPRYAVSYRVLEPERQKTGTRSKQTAPLLISLPAEKGITFSGHTCYLYVTA
jgi:hypothetical protein